MFSHHPGSPGWLVEPKESVSPPSELGKAPYEWPWRSALVPVARRLATETHRPCDGPIKALSFLRGSAEFLNVNYF